jgi:tungstate transport system substrate-binding protein
MKHWITLLLAALVAAACAPVTPPPAVLRLATTTSTDDSGLLDAILPTFEGAYNARVEVVAVGTGQALALGARGDADVVLVHARAQEDAFMAAGDGLERRDVMYNDFVIAGPADDPAAVAAAASAADALARIAQAEAPWASRGDNSGTHTKELSLWASAAISPTGSTWYAALGQGMGETLIYANEQGAYTLADRGTFLAMRERLPRLEVLFGGATIADNTDPALLNPYGVIVVSPDKHPGVNAALAGQFAAWLAAPETQAAIGAFGRDRYGQPLFYPAAAQPPAPAASRRNHR